MPLLRSLSTGYEQTDRLNLPIDIDSGISKRWVFVARGETIFASESDAQSALGHVKPSLIWTFVFGDGKEVTWENQLFASDSKLNFEQNCLDYQDFTPEH